MTAYTLSQGYNLTAARITLLKKIETHIFISFFVVLLIVFFVTLPTTQGGSLFSKNPEGKLISYKLANIPEDSLIIYDDRIYNSLAGWLFNDRYYIPISLLDQFMSYNQNSTAKQRVTAYIIECVPDDCGWGTISKNQPLNQSMEGFFAMLQNNSVSAVYTATQKIGNVKYYNPLISKEIFREDYFKVYKVPMDIDLNLAKQVKYQYEYFLYPTGYLNKNSATFKNFVYEPTGAFEKMLNKIAWWVFYLNIILSFGAILLVIYEIYIRL